VIVEDSVGPAIGFKDEVGTTEVDGVGSWIRTDDDFDTTSDVDGVG
jgi:hypothetical protein